MISYAGIGSRQITDSERETIIKIANRLSEKYVLYSGNCTGADINFQKGSNKNCVLFLPWKGFNTDIYSINDCLDWYDAGKSLEGLKSIKPPYHKNPEALSYGGRYMMARNYHQVMGSGAKYPPVSFVICCASRKDDGSIKGGTAFACNLAESLNIPVINIRDAFYEELLEQTLKDIK